MNIETKLTQLSLAVERTDEVLKSGKRVAITRHLNALQTTANEAHECKRTTEAEKIASKEELSKIKEWNNEINQQFEAADVAMSELEKCLRDIDKAEQFETHKEQLEMEQVLHERRLKMKAELASVPKPKTDAFESKSFPAETAKLPKLVISKFSGSYMDWPKFWGQFSEAIDKSSLPAVTKFTYLLELLELNVKRHVESLPFSPEGYNRAKVILKDKYGKESEIVKCYMKEILDLPHISGTNPRKVAEFCSRLTHSVQALETMGKLSNISGNVSMTLDKLSGIRGDLVRTDTNWESWDFIQFTDALNQWVKRNPVVNSSIELHEIGRKRVYHAQSDYSKLRGCVYCGDLNHKANQCETVTEVKERKAILSRKGLCFNCATKTHRASECTSKTACGHCNKRHHTSICDQRVTNNINVGKDKHSSRDKLMTDGTGGEGIFPVVVVKVNGVTCRALIDSGAGSSYASASLINTLNIQPSEIKRQQIDMLMTSRTSNISIYDVSITSLEGTHEMPTRLSKVEKPELLSVNNPEYETLISRYRHLRSVKMHDNDTKSQLPIHVILGNGEYSRIKTSTKPLIGGDGEPVAEKTKFGWTILSPGSEFDQSKMLLTQTSSVDFDRLCRLDVLGLEDGKENDQHSVYTEFREQLTRSAEGWYETGLPWRGNHPPLPTNATGSRRRLENLVRRLKATERYQEYHDVIAQQLDEGVIEAAPLEVNGKEFYLPHKAVVKQTAETTKLRVVYDASARESSTSPSLNDCLNPGPCLQNHLWAILIRSRFLPILLTGDLEKAFLQVRIKEAERDALRFYWRPPGSDVTHVYRFTRALFGLTCSPFLLGGVLNEHLQSWRDKYPSLVEEIRRSLYVDDLMTGGATTSKVLVKKTQASRIFEDATFKLHKWHSNAVELESPPVDEDGETTFAKQQFRTDSDADQRVVTKLLGLPWDKAKDSLAVMIGTETGTMTKRSALSQLAKIYDPLGLVSPITLVGKNLFREMCEARLAWDGELPKGLRERWEDWCRGLPNAYEIPRALAPREAPITAITLHAFGDASKAGVSAAVYAVVEQDQKITQGLVCAKSRLAKRSLSIPRLELVAGHMAVNLLTNVEKEIDQHLVSSTHCWLDSTVALYWIKGHGQYRQFVANRVEKIQGHHDVKWHHVSTKENPADLGSRGGNVVGNDLWKNGPKWLSDPGKWPTEIELQASTEANQELRSVVGTRAFATVKPTVDNSIFNELLRKFSLRKVLRVSARVHRFIHNCRTLENNSRRSGPLTTAELLDTERWWTKRTQKEAELNPEFERVKVQLNIQLNNQGLFECRGRVEGEYPIYLPQSSEFTEKVVERAHLQTLHGGVSMTMAKVREQFWVPKLRRLVKRVRSRCHGCAKFRAQAYKTPPPGKLPASRTQGTTPFEVTGVDFAGPIKYRSSARSEKKAYLVLYGCSLTRAVYLELLNSLEVTEFILSLKRFIARRGRPRLVYSDNAKTFKAADKWLKLAEKDEKFNAFLADNAIEWRFNLSRAPWWGGQFERLIGLFKRAFYKTISNGMLTREELEEVVLDVEVALNNRPLTYLENDVELFVLTPSSMLNVNPCSIPEIEAHNLPERSLRKRAKQLKKCKENMWNRWTREYIRGLRERHRQLFGKQSSQPKIGDVVMIQGDEKNRNLWKVGVVNRLIEGKDKVVRGVRVRTTNGFLERAIQQIYPLELSCNESTWKPNPNATPYIPRPTRDAAVAANVRLEQTAEETCDCV